MRRRRGSAINAHGRGSQPNKNLKKMAESLDPEVRKKAASRAFQKHFSTLMKIISPLQVAAEAFSEGIIDKATLDNVSKQERNYGHGAYDVLSVVSNMVEDNPDVFLTFCDILANERSTEERSKALRGI